MCVGVTVWFGWGGVVSLCKLKHSFYCSTCFECQYIHLQELATYCGFISCVVMLWFDVCWCYGVVRLEWCGILMQAEAQLLLFNMFRMLVHPSSGACDLLW
jgi:hypothetical protein